MTQEEWSRVKEKVKRFFRSAGVELRFSSIHSDLLMEGFAKDSCCGYALSVVDEGWRLTIRSFEGETHLRTPEGEERLCFADRYDESTETGKRFATLAHKMEQKVDKLCGMMQILPLG